MPRWAPELVGERRRGKGRGGAGRGDRSFGLNPFPWSPSSPSVASGKEVSDGVLPGDAGEMDMKGMGDIAGDICMTRDDMWYMWGDQRCEMLRKIEREEW